MNDSNEQNYSENETEESCNELYFIDNDKDNEHLSLDINRTISSNKSCFVCKANSNDTNLKSISKDGIIDVYLKKKILIKINSRCCESHLTNGKRRRYWNAKSLF